jgi:hypothetical protein
MITESNKILVQTLRLVKIGKKYNLKSVEVTDSFIRIEFNESSTPIADKKSSKRDKRILEEFKESAYLEEMQLLDPEAYEEELMKKDGGLKEI